MVVNARPILNVVKREGIFCSLAPKYFHLIIKNIQQHLTRVSNKIH